MKGGKQGGEEERERERNGIHYLFVNRHFGIRAMHPGVVSIWGILFLQSVCVERV